jgi:uncharacterized protein YqkB
MHYNIFNKNNPTTQNYLESKIDDIFKNIFKELLIFSFFYYFLLTFLFIFLYQIFFNFFPKQEDSNKQVFLKKIEIPNYLAFFNIFFNYQDFSFCLFKNNFMVLSFVYSNNIDTNLLLTKRDIYSYELISKIYTFKLGNYRANYTKLNLNDLALIDLFINLENNPQNDYSKNRFLNLTFDSNLNFIKSYEFIFDNINYKINKVLYNNGFYYLLFSVLSYNDLEDNDKVVLVKMDCNQKIYDIKLIKLPYKIESIDFYYPFIFFNISFNDQNKIFILKLEDKNYLEFSTFLVEHNYLRMELLQVINFKDNYLLIFKSFANSLNSELIFINVSDEFKIQQIIKFSSNIIDLIKIEKIIAFDNNLYFIYKFVNDEKALGIMKINILNNSYFNKVIFTNEERKIKFLDSTNLFKNLLLFWDYSNNDISILSLNLINENKINNNIDPIFITDYDYYFQNKFVFNFNTDSKDIKIKFLLQKNLLIYTNIDKNYFHLDSININIIDIKDLKISNKEINFF